MLLSRLLEGVGETTAMGGGTVRRSTVASSSGLPNASGLEPPPPVSEAVPRPLDPLMLLWCDFCEATSLHMSTRRLLDGLFADVGGEPLEAIAEPELSDILPDRRTRLLSDDPGVVPCLVCDGLGGRE